MPACSTGSGTSSTSMAGPAQGWKAVELAIPSRFEEELVALVAGQVLGVQVEPDTPERCRMELYVETDSDLRALKETVAGFLTRSGIDPSDCALTEKDVPDGRWVEAYQESLHPFPAGERFMIYPGEPPRGEPGCRMPILLVPGRAFGTGEHATTRLCLRALEQAVSPGSRWLDVGCGSGILGVAAALLGAEEVYAVDNDPDAVEVCREVAEANQVTGTVQAVEGSLQQIAATGLDGVVANIHAPFFLEHAAGLHRLLRPGGVLLCTGFLRTDVPEIGRALVGAGLGIRETRHEAEWALTLADAPS